MNSEAATAGRTISVQGNFFARWIKPGVRDLYPGYFAMVMGTGIISNAFYLLDHRWLSDFLLIVNLIAFPLLTIATFARAVYYPRQLWGDLTNPRVVFAFFTIVAGMDVLGMQLFLRDFTTVAAVLWVSALVIWVLLSYFSFSVLTFVNSESGADVAHGGWLIAIVGTESLVLLGALLAPEFGSLSDLTFVGIHMLWGIGIVLYGIFITLFSFRIFFARIEPEDMNPLFWVVMGAAAIAANAGSTLIMASPSMPFLVDLRPFLEASTLILWAWGSWWIPLLVVFGIWRHVVRRQPLEYSPMFWSLVFPLGMYTVASYRLELAADFPPLRVLPQITVWVALLAWGLTIWGLLRSGRRSARVALDRK